ncbi:MAG: aspartate/glutamate racemase family protein [Pseudomonadota bacterium]|nr:aspartate/glutamate racemase family protein [Pseudomonadota bacterium]
MASRILYQLVSPLHLTAGEAEIARRLRMLQAWAPSSQIRIASPRQGPRAVESASDVAMVFPHLREAAAGWAAEGLDAVVVGCFSDPGVDALAEISSVPVIGPGEAGILAAMQGGGRFSVLSSSPTPPGLRRRIRGIGAEPMFLSEAMIGGSVADLIRAPERHLPGIVRDARRCVSQGAETIVLGCFALSFMTDLPAMLAKELGVPVINPVVAGLKAAEAAVHYRAGLGRPRQTQHSEPTDEA